MRLSPDTEVIAMTLQEIVATGGVTPTGQIDITENGIANVYNYATANVQVPQPSGKVTITENATGLDIAQYAEADIAVPQGITPTGTINIDQNGDTDVTDYATAHVAVPQYGKPTVSQTGGWQFTTTPTKGYIILGKDDDLSDNAKFVRMVNGYNYPVVLNSEAKNADTTLSSDADSEYSQYPVGSVSKFPDGVSVRNLNKYLLANPNLGEVALHDGGQGVTWSSDKLTGTTLDNYYDTYTTGGGLKTKEEFKSAMMQEYADTDIAQGASRVSAQRNLLQSSINGWVYTIGKWGGHKDFIIDGINVGTSTPVEESTNADGFSRSLNFMGDGQLVDLSSNSPYYIYRHLYDDLQASAVNTDLEKAYTDKRCIEVFFHNFVSNTEASWTKAKDLMDNIKTYVDAGKVQVVTRKQYYELGEIVEHPIVRLSLTTDAQYYAVGSTITASNFICKAVLDNDTEVTCESDKILDISDVDTSTAGSYTATLEYRGFKTSCTVIISNSQINYLLQNYSTSGNGLVRQTNVGDLPESITYSANKTYKIEFDFSGETTVSYSSHYIGFKVASVANNWCSCAEVRLNTVEGTSAGHVVIELTTSANKAVSKFVYITGIDHTTVGDWTISNGCIYEVTE